MTETKEKKEAFRSKKINKLTIREAKDLKDYLERAGNKGSVKYTHVVNRLKFLNND